MRRPPFSNASTLMTIVRLCGASAPFSPIFCVQIQPAPKLEQLVIEYVLISSSSVASVILQWFAAEIWSWVKTATITAFSFQARIRSVETSGIAVKYSEINLVWTHSRQNKSVCSVGWTHMYAYVCICIYIYIIHIHIQHTNSIWYYLHHNEHTYAKSVEQFDIPKHVSHIFRNEMLLKSRSPFKVGLPIWIIFMFLGLSIILSQSTMTPMRETVLCPTLQSHWTPAKASSATPGISIEAQKPTSLKHPVDGRNPAPPWMVDTLSKMGWATYQLV